MCGIFGLVSDRKGFLPDRGKLLASAALLSHRGPDDNSVDTGPGFGFAHARLSLVDLDARSNQPFWDLSRRYVLVYNGEVYNFQTLRTEMEQQGLRFRTRSDTEVVLQMLIHLPPAEALRRLEGMFALAFYDCQTRRLILARDRFGMKPLIWTRQTLQGEGALFFGSEVKALRPWIDLRADAGSLYAYLMKFPGPTSGKTMFEGIFSLAPGEMLDIRAGQAPLSSRFFTLPDFMDGQEAERLNRLSPREVIDEFDSLMDASIASHRFADARVGAFCSGGVDSSLIVAMAARRNKDVALFHAEVQGSWSELE
ncbi:MAG: asparagine synthetase B, partial [Rhodobacteraceae bacterium]|nr:asparagine synthetase B [Paracoccaceae bacterium]